MKQVEGFLAEDGAFFESSTEAEYHEAKGALHDAAIPADIDPERLCAAIDQLFPQVERYVNAKKAHDAVAPECAFGQSIETETNRPRVNRTDEQRATEANAPVLKQPSRKRQPVPDVGSRK